MNQANEAAQGAAAAPWRDFHGNTIRHGDRLVHPDGNTFVAIRLEGHDEESDAWRAVYDYDPSHVSRLNIQIGDRGRAALKAQPAPTEAAQGEDSARLAASDLATIEEATKVLESAAKYNEGLGRTVFAHVQRDRAARLRAILDRAAPQPQEKP